MSHPTHRRRELPTRPWRAVAIAALAVAGAGPVHATLPLQFNASGTVEVARMEVDSAGNVYVLAEFPPGSPSIACPGNNTTLTSSAVQTLFVAKYDETGNCKWLYRISSSGTPREIEAPDQPNGMYGQMGKPLNKADLAIYETATGAVDVYLAGLFAATAANNQGSVLIGPQEVTYQFANPNREVLYLAKIGAPAETPAPGAPPVTFSARAVEAGYAGWCKDYANLGGLAVAGRDAGFQVFVAVTGREGCDHNLLSFVVEADATLGMPIDQIFPVVRDNDTPDPGDQAYIDYVASGTDAFGSAVVVFGGRRGDSDGSHPAPFFQPYVAAYSFESHDWRWIRDFNRPSSPTHLDASSRVVDVEVDPGATAFTLLLENLYFWPPQGTQCLPRDRDSLLRIGLESGTPLGSSAQGRILTDPTLSVSRLTYRPDGQAFVAGRVVQATYEAPSAAKPLGDCLLSYPAWAVARIAPDGTAYASTWQQSVAATAPHANGVAIGGNRLFVGANTLAGNNRWTVRRLSPVNGEWYSENSWTAEGAILRPALALPGRAPVTRLAGEADGSGADSVFWSILGAGGLLAVHPLPADRPVLTLSWETGRCSASPAKFCGVDGDCPGGETCNANPAVPGEPVESFGSIVWPTSPQPHLVGAPTKLTIGAPSWSFQGMLYEDPDPNPEGQGSVLTGDRFERDSAGYSVLHYVFTDGNGGQLDQLQVVQTSPWPAAAPDGGACTIGTPLARPAAAVHDDPGREGYPVGNTPIDVTAIDLETRLGALVPVNVTLPGTREMQVAYYLPDFRGRRWPVNPRSYTCGWPSPPHGILFPDSLMGSDACRCTTQACLDACQGIANPLAGAVAGNATIYIQNDPAVKGYNPNDEHAFITAPNPSPPCAAPASPAAWCTTSNPGARTIYALRQQVGAVESDPYVILKTPGTPPTYRVFKVAMSSTSNTFAFDVEVGERVPKPFPLDPVLQDCPGTQITDVVGTPRWQASDGSVWARADGTMRADFYYRGPVALGFHPLNGCHRWLEGTTVNYVASWPADAPTLRIGESLSLTRDGFPPLAGATSAQVVFEGDLSAPSAVQGARHLVRLFDPVVTRYVAVLPRDLDLFRELKKRVPTPIGIRLEIDELGPRLGWKGIQDSRNVIGNDPLLLLNVITTGELAELESTCLDLASADLVGVCRPTVRALYDLARNPAQLPAGPTAVLVGLGVDGQALRLENAAAKVLSAGAPSGEGWATVALDDVPGGDLRLYPIKIRCAADGGPYPGIAFAVDGANVFGFGYGLRHSNDFGGEPGRAVFEWQRFVRTDDIYAAPYDRWGTPTAPGTRCDQAGEGECWSGPLDSNSVQIDIDGEANSVYIGDTYFFVRYEYTNPAVCGQSSWTGDPRTVGSPAPPVPVAKLAAGWVKRVVEGLDPFHQRIVDFHLESSPVATYASMIRQAGPAYEGPIAFNPAADNVNDIGLIETYETVLRRALEVTVEKPGYTPSASIDNALLLVSGRIADLYMLLGNEAWADAVDPTIGFGTESGEYGTLAPSIHAFQNQLPSLLEEELALLRGVDSYGLRPAYNRLLWNFTSGEGEAAYAQVYGITDQDGNGDVSLADARALFPQGHGDAWGHYLTSMVEYLRLLREPDFAWKPRVEAVDLGGTAQLVDYRDERKLAAAAAARARTGAEIVDLTYRREFVQDPDGQWQGYKDPDRLRAWGVDDWARRAAQGAYLDWAVANAVLPAEWEQPDAEDRDCDLVAEGVAVPEEECYRNEGGLTFDENGEVDRARVPELAEIAQRFREIEGTLDEADQGLNPLGLARGVVPFDIDPSFLDVGSVIQGQTHFEQIYLRATAALNNAISTFDHANRVTQMLRKSQDSLVDFERNVEDQERDFRNRLIETFGRPFPDDSFYPPGYEGPDIRHFAYVDARSLTGMPPAAAFAVGLGASGSSALCFQRTIPPDTPCGDLFPTESEYCALLDPGALPDAEETCIDSELGLVKPPTWNAGRPAEGELQRIYSEHLRALAALEQSTVEYENLRAEIASKAELIELHTGSLATSIMIVDDAIGRTKSLSDEIQQQRETARGLRTGAGFYRGLVGALNEALSFDLEADMWGISAPQVDAFSLSMALARSAKLLESEIVGFGMEMGADAAENQADSLADRRDLIALQTDRRLLVETEFIEVEELVREIESLLRQEPLIALQAFDRREAVRSTAVAWGNELARGLRLFDEVVILRQRAAADVQRYRYQDLTFRIARNDALQKYRAQFDLAARYTYLAAAAYDYETNLLATAGGAGQDFFTDIVRHRSLGEVLDGEPAPGSRGLADPLGRMKANFDVLEGQLGFNNPQTETNYFSLRGELLRLRDSSDAAWQRRLREAWVPDLWALPEFRRLARPFAPEGSQPEPALVLRFRTTVTSGLNYFGWPLGGQDSTYDSSRYATKIRTVGLWLENYDGAGLSNTPRVYLLPVGADILRSPNANDFTTREWNVVDQVIPVPFPIGELNLQDPDWIPLNDSLSGQLGASRRFSRFRAYHDAGFDPEEMTTDSRLIGRSVWNSEWMLIIPGETLKGPTLADKIEGLETFVNSVSDLKLFFQTYSYPGN